MNQYAVSNYNRAVKFDLGKTVQKNFAEAFKHYTLAAKKGHAKSQFCLGQMYRCGEGVEKDDRLSVYWYTEAAKNGSIDAQFELGDMYYRGIKVPQNIPRAIELFTLAAEQNCELSLHELGIYYRDQGDVDKAIEMLEKAAKMKYRDSMTALAKLYMDKGRVDEAVNLYIQAGVLGCETAQYTLGKIYFDGRLINKNLQMAEYWLRKVTYSTSAHSQYAQFYLGLTLLFIHKGTKKMSPEIGLIFMQLAKSGHKRAQYWLGKLYMSGYGGLSKDFNKGAWWIEESAKEETD